MWWGRFIIDWNLELQKIPWKTTTLILVQLQNAEIVDSHFL